MDSDFLRLARRVKKLEMAEPPTVHVRFAGEMLLWPGSMPPEGWLICDGAVISRSEYAPLFAVIGTTYGGGDGSTTFSLPDLKGRVPAGHYQADAAFRALGVTGGAKTHALGLREMPYHSHSQNAHTHSFSATTSGVGDHTHYIKWYVGAEKFVALSGNGSGPSSSGYQTGYSSGTVYNEAMKAAPAGGHEHSVYGICDAATAEIQYSGAGDAHNNLQPYLVLNYVIKC